MEWTYLAVWLVSIAGITVFPIVGGMVVVVKLLALAGVTWN